MGYFYQSLEPVMAIQKQGRELDSRNTTDGSNYLELRTKPIDDKNGKKMEGKGIANKTVVDHVVPLKDILFIKDTEVINRDFANKLVEREL